MIEHLPFTTAQVWVPRIIESNTANRQSRLIRDVYVVYGINREILDIRVEWQVDDPELFDSYTTSTLKGFFSWIIFTQAYLKAKVDDKVP